MDVNADLAEGFGRWELGDDTALLDIVSSANVACGFHAGDPRTLRRACSGAAARGVAVGAQVGYRDLAGFGRRFIDVDPGELVDEVIYQIGALDALARVAGTAVTYVKPHGALYNTIVSHTAQAEAVVEAVRRFRPGMAVLGLAGSEWLRLAEQSGLDVHREAFADRAYTPEGTLVPRGRPGAVLHDAELIADRCLRIVRGRPIEAVDGTPLSLSPDSLCVHGDTPDAVEIARAVRRKLTEQGTVIEPFAPPPTGPVGR
ncbi:hypothetical protein CDG81_16825 [Actinopolyspora erythraea]|uniref:5-oxoprolinase subunit A n=1 Tax=Actinopolyspora erythraea TaxID=414996 RepID=A0A099CZL8_9ACTN|nr:5-oxoprolinase subunit PxpA [Actinopolyspora erythraea]ASU79655.1 hypothetical protein CDG81_16825 [Actinopolyspora erythraea]KGI79418.1 hypothetical protein IL38_23290 [Actinopolyspora erythraea]